MSCNNFSRFQILILLISLTVFVANANAQTSSSWIGGSGIWSEASNWSSGVPNGDFNAVLAVPAVTIRQDLSQLEIVGLQLRHGSADLVLDQDLAVNGDLKWNSASISGIGTLQLHGNGKISSGVLDTTVENFGQVTLRGNPCITTTNEAVWFNKSGAIMELAPGAVVGGFPNEQSATIVNEIGATFRQSATASANYILWDMDNEGTIQVSPNSQFLFVRDFQQSATGEIKLNGGGVDFFQDVIFSGKISGSGSIANVGSGFDLLLVPGGGGIGGMQVAGSFHMTPQTMLNIQIGADGTADSFSNIGGPVILNGVINVEALAGAAAGTYQLVSWNNGSNFRDDGIQLGSVPVGFQGSLLVDSVKRSLKLEILEMAEFFGAASFDVVFGQQVGGEFAALAASDDQRLQLQSGGNTFRPRMPIGVDVTSFLPDDSPVSLKLSVESSVTVPGFRQRIEFYNFATSRYELITVDDMNVIDLNTLAEAPGDVSRFVENETGKVVARIGFVPSGQINQRGWRAEIDKIAWAVEN